MQSIKIAVIATLLIQPSNQYACISNLYHRFFDWCNPTQIAPNNDIEVHNVDDRHITFSTHQPYSSEVHLELSGTPGNPAQVPTSDANSCVFCHPTTKVLYDDTQMRVLTKPGNRPGTDILLVPTEHRYLNVAAMNFGQEADKAVIEQIASVADKLAHSLTNKQATYTLTTNTGVYQRVYHLHVHFKSAATLNSDNLAQPQ